MASAVLWEVLPLALGAAVSPLLLIGEVLCLSAPSAGLRRGWLFAGGNGLVVAIWLAIGLAMGQALPDRQRGSDPISACLHLAMGLVLLTVAVQLRLHPASAAAPPRPRPEAGHPLRRSFALGVVMMAQNLSTLALFFPAVTAVARAGQGPAASAADLGLLCLITLSPSLLPALLATFGGERARRALDRGYRWLQPRQRAVAIVMLLVLGSALLLSGVSRL